MSESKVLRRIEQLRKEIEEHNHKYYVQAKPSISDYDFDMLLEELIKPILNNDYKHIEKKTKLENQIIEFVKAIKDERGSEDSIFNDYKKQASLLIEKLNS